MTSCGRFRGLLVLFFFLASIFFVTAGPPTAQAQEVVVSAAVPDNSPQGTVNLNVTIKGKGFKKGAKAQWFVTGTTNPGGVTVNSTAFVSSTELAANITVAAEAQTDKKFDIKVTLSSGRTGKGIELFSVTVPARPADCYSSAPGCLDTSFGDGTGKVTTKTAAGTPYESSSASAQAVAIQANGAIVAAGNTPDPNDGTRDFALVRYNSDGSLDLGFGTGGIVTGKSCWREVPGPTSHWPA
ncbi:MAG TPA: delta-60 repeat domain-containing protein [Terriglobia bacterium]|nr:delta-60 repeat domain-containing protein [Terriglobia bacterium]